MSKRILTPKQRAGLTNALTATIIEGIKLDPVLRKCRSFSALHNKADANVIFGQDLVWNWLHENEEEMESVLCEAQDRVDKYLHGGRKKGG